VRNLSRHARLVAHNWDQASRRLLDAHLR